MTILLPSSAVLSRLRKECDKAGGLRAWSRANHISAPYVSRVLRGEKEIGDSIAKALGLRKNVAWAVDRRRGRE